MANEIVNKQVNIFITSGEAQRSMDALLAKKQKLEERLKISTDPREITRINSELKKLEEPISRAAKKVSGELSPSFKDLQATVNSLGARLRRMSTQDADYSKVLVQYNAANIALKEQKQNIDKLANAHDKLKKDSLAGKVGIGAFFGSLAGNLVTQAIGQLQNLGREAIRTALEAEGVRNAFNRLNQPGLLDNLRKATRGTVSDLELMKRAVTANNFQIPLERLGTLLEFAQRRARETGQSVDYLVDSIVTGIARKSPLILDNLGINIQRINTEFKNTGDFAQAAFNVVEQELEKAGPAVETMADRVDRLRARWEGFWEQVGEGLLSIAENIADADTKIFGSAEDKAEIKKREFNQKIAKENENARNQELVQIEDFRKQYAAADAQSKADLLRQAQLFIRDEETQEILHRENLQIGDARLISIRLKLWQDFYDELTGKAKNNADTIENLQKDIQLTTEIRDKAIIGSEQFNQAVARLKELQDRLDKLLGRGQNKREKENLFSRFKQQLDEQARELDAFNALQVDKELAAAQNKYERLLEQLKDAQKNQKLTIEQFGDLVNQLADQRGREETLILERWAQEMNRRRLEEEKKHQKELKQLEATRLQQLLQFQEKLAGQLADVTEKGFRRRAFNLEVQELLANGRQRLNIKIQQLRLEREEEIKNAEETGKLVSDIVAKYDKLIHDAKIGSFQEQAQQIIDIFKQVATQLGAVFALQNQRDEAELEQLRNQSDAKKKIYESEFNSKIISRKEYEKKVTQLDRQVEQKEKQIRLKEFNRQKITSLINATINVAEAVTAALDKGPIYAAFIGALGALQIGLIASQPPPKFAKGGRLNKGKLHSEGGMPIVDPATGQKVAEIEKDEGIVNRHTMRERRRYTVSGTPSQIISKLNSLYGREWEGGAVMTPEWRNSYVPMINTTGIQKHMQQLKFAAGGVFGQSAVGTSDLAIQALSASVERLDGILNYISSNGIRAYTVLSQHNRQQERQTDILSDVTMK